MSLGMPGTKCYATQHTYYKNTHCIPTHKTLNISTYIPLYYFTSFAPENGSKPPILGDLDSYTLGHKTYRFPYPRRDKINLLLLPHATTALSGSVGGAAPLAPPRSQNHACLSKRGSSLSTTPSSLKCMQHTMDKPPQRLLAIATESTPRRETAPPVNPLLGPPCPSRHVGRPASCQRHTT